MAFRVIAALLLAGVALVQGACPNDCNGNGYCTENSSCVCYRNWVGNDCSQRMCYYGRAFVDSPQGDTNSNGYLDVKAGPTRHANAKTWESFSLDYGAGALAANLIAEWGSDTNAADAAKWSEGHFFAECSNKGTCDRATGLCVCWPGYEGSGCTRLSCPTVTETPCSGHGTCHRLADLDSTYAGWDKEKTTQCTCDAGFTGIDCAQRVCPSGDDPVAKYSQFTQVCYANAHGSTNGATYQDGTDAWFEVYGGTSGAVATMPFDSVAPKIYTGTTHCYNLINVRGNFMVGEVLYKADGTQLNGANALSTVTVASAWGADVQAKEKQRVTTNSGSESSGYAATFTLTFTDEYGAKWTTNTIATASYTTCGALATAVETALEQLPNKVIEDVQLTTASTGNPNAAKCELDVEFTSNSGNLPLMTFNLVSASHANTVAVAVQTEGTTENAPCSNRGACDHETGLCKCFQGFASHDCSKQNALAMV